MFEYQDGHGMDGLKWCKMGIIKSYKIYNLKKA